MAKRKSKKTNVAKVSAKTASAKPRPGKRKMSEQQEFEVMKLVLDKFLWLGFIVMGFGMYISLSTGYLSAGAWYMFAGAILLLLFLFIIVKEYELIEGR